MTTTPRGFRSGRHDRTNSPRPPAPSTLSSLVPFVCVMKSSFSRDDSRRMKVGSMSPAHFLSTYDSMTFNRTGGNLTLTAGSRLGPYEILSAIGAGGMGEVYRARDTRLERTVAVKVLPEHLTSDADLRQRFEREAKTISQLSHPHICALYDVGREGDADYLVMEYLEGETLASRLEKGALPSEQLLRYGIEIGRALDKAHRQGIVHRDLKPGNVMLTKSGVKLLDFGL